ncbi:hypothetical protein BY458DRAFT_539499 [Sporodiniella umbellata]|nr:hypothetical protein BY458DRAFT_539499 [Sporodiniella umbellata]
MNEYYEKEYDAQDESWDDWHDEEQTNIQCLYCQTTLPSTTETFQHMKTSHEFDFQALRQSLQLDFYECIRLINYIRQQVKENAGYSETSFDKTNDLFKQDVYLQPVLEDDVFLFAFDDDQGSDLQEDRLDPAQVQPTTSLEKQLLKSLLESQASLKTLQQQFDDYKLTFSIFSITMASYGTLPYTSLETPVLDWRKRLGKTLETSRFHIVILGLTLLDALCVLIQITFTFFHECSSAPFTASSWLAVAFRLAELFSLLICILFMSEILLSLIAFGPAYYLPGWPHWKLHLFDATVVTTTFVLEFVLKGKEREVAGLLIVFRLWRVVKVIEAVVLSVNFTNEETLDKMKKKYAELEDQLKAEQEKNIKLEQQLNERETLI